MTEHIEAVTPGSVRLQVAPPSEVVYSPSCVPRMRWPTFPGSVSKKRGERLSPAGSADWRRKVE
jgi:hypothetical protein